MNQLKLSQQQSILTLHKAGWSNRAIARELGLNRETVGKYLRSESPRRPGSDRRVRSAKTSHFDPRLFGGRRFKTSHFDRRVGGGPKESLRALGAADYQRRWNRG